MSYKIMTWDPIDVGWEDDSFASGWGWNGTVVTVTRNGDIIEIKTNAGYSSGVIEKTGFSVNAATYKYLVICVKGNAKRYTEIYDGTWKWVEGSYPDAPSEYDVLIYDISGITTRTVTGIRLGVYGGELKSAWYDFVGFCSVQPQFCTDKVISLYVKQRETDVDEFEILGTDDIGSGLTIGRHLRIFLKGSIDERRKVFAGVIEESSPEDSPGKVLRITGRDWAQKLLLRTKSKSFNVREVSLAVKDFVEDLTEITTYQVETPSPTVNITKDFTYTYIIDGLKDLAAWVGSDWEVKLGMGHDLRFRSRSSANVPSLSFSITEADGHILRNVSKETDGYRAYNKVVIIGGVWLNESGDKDEWAESTTGWTVSSGAALSAVSGAPVGSYYLRLQTINQLNWYCERSIASQDCTKFQSLKMYLSRIALPADTEFWIRIGQNIDNCKSFPMSALGGVPEGEMTEFTIPLNHPSWQTTGSPNMAAVNWMRINPINENIVTGSLNFDGIHFYAPTLIKTSSTTNDFRHTREYVYRDPKIVNPSFAEAVADALLNVLKNKENRYRLPLIGIPTVQVGHKATVNSPTWGLNGSYYIVEAIHQITWGGYITEMILENPRLYLEKLLAEAIERKIKLIERGDVS